MEKEFVSNTWAMSGWIISYNAGILALSENMISFISARGEEFKVPLMSITNVKWPMLQLGYGVNFDAAGKTYKFTFMQPNGQSPLDSDAFVGFGRIAIGISAIKTLSRAKEYKTIANKWKEVLGK